MKLWIVTSSYHLN